MLEGKKFPVSDNQAEDSASDEGDQGSFVFEIGSSEPNLSPDSPDKGSLEVVDEFIDEVAIGDSEFGVKVDQIETPDDEDNDPSLSSLDVERMGEEESSPPSFEAFAVECSLIDVLFPATVRRVSVEPEVGNLVSNDVELDTTGDEDTCSPTLEAFGPVFCVPGLLLAVIVGRAIVEFEEADSTANEVDIGIEEDKGIGRPWLEALAVRPCVLESLMLETVKLTCAEVDVNGGALETATAVDVWFAFAESNVVVFKSDDVADSFTLEDDEAMLVLDDALPFLETIEVNPSVEIGEVDPVREAFAEAEIDFKNDVVKLPEEVFF